MGILPLRFPAGVNPQALAIRPGDTVHLSALPERIEPRCTVPVRIQRADGRVETFEATAAVETQLETALLRRGGVIPDPGRHVSAATFEGFGLTPRRCPCPMSDAP